MDPRRILQAGLVMVLAGAAGPSCSEGGLTSGPGDDPPGQAAETRQVTVPVTDFAGWRDSTFLGFATPSTVSYLLAAQDSALQSRALLKFGEVPDTVIINAQLLPIDSVGGIFLRFTTDTARTRTPGDSLAVSVFTLDGEFDPRQADWHRAAEGAPWTPGGGLVRRLGRSRIQARSDTFSVRVDANSDSLWRAWSEMGTPSPMAVLVNTPSTRLFLRNAVLEFRAKPPEQDTLAPTSSVVEERTFIYDPAQPEPGSALRLGGNPSARVYLEFQPPDTVAGLPLRGSQINRAELLFEPLGTGSPLFRPDAPVNALAFQLLADPFELGAKTPIGGALRGGRVLRLLSDSLEAGRELAVNVTDIFTAWTELPPDSVRPIRIGLRPLPDGGRFGFWEFGSATADSAALRPRLRLLLTPPTPFTLP